MANPFTLVFGKRPLEFVDRPKQIFEIMDAFTSENINQQMFVITGVRGAGKTVTMSEIAQKLRDDDNWIVLELNPATDLLQSMLSKLYSDKTISSFIKTARIDLSFFGFGVSIEGSTQITDSETAIIKILEKIKSEGKRLLIFIDEMSNTEYMKVFAGSFQIFVRQDLPVFLLGTGLYENIEELQNEKNLTFLYRAPKIQLKPLKEKVTAELNSFVLTGGFFKKIVVRNDIPHSYYDVKGIFHCSSINLYLLYTFISLILKRFLKSVPSQIPCPEQAQPYRYIFLFDLLRPYILLASFVQPFPSILVQSHDDHDGNHR